MMADELLPMVYVELRRLAARQLAAEAAGQTLCATALVHEAWLKLADGSIHDRNHFLKLAARAMRQILIDRARAKKSVKRTAGRRVELHDVAETMPGEQLLDVDDALRKLAMLKPGHAELLELRFFAGLSNDDAAKVLDVSPSTADRMARYAYAWLRVELADDDTAPLPVGS